jgi:Cof subfamily protein (haloacid dehalogenase superfamily)
MTLLPSPQLPVRLVVSDLDGTLLDADGRVPASFWPLLADMQERGVIFAPASGRQYATLARMFAPPTRGVIFIAENGAYVVREGVEISSSTLDPGFVEQVIGRIRELALADSDVGVVVCGKRSAYVERTDDPFIHEVDQYYVALEQVTDLLEVDDAVLKLAVFDFAEAETGAAVALAPFSGSHQVVVSGHHWIDVLDIQINKGVAVRDLQHRLMVSPAETVVFGDYLNDLEMLDRGELSFAMTNAHPQVLARARYRAPSNTDLGVIKVLRTLLAPNPNGSRPVGNS